MKFWWIYLDPMHFVTRLLGPLLIFQLSLVIYATFKALLSRTSIPTPLKDFGWAMTSFATRWRPRLAGLVPRMKFRQILSISSNVAFWEKIGLHVVRGHGIQSESDKIKSTCFWQKASLPRSNSLPNLFDDKLNLLSLRSLMRDGQTYICFQFSILTYSQDPLDLFLDLRRPIWG